MRTIPLFLVLLLAACNNLQGQLPSKDDLQQLKDTTTGIMHDLPETAKSTVELTKREIEEAKKKARDIKERAEKVQEGMGKISEGQKLLKEGISGK